MAQFLGKQVSVNFKTMGLLLMGFLFLFFGVRYGGEPLLSQAQRIEATHFSERQRAYTDSRMNRGLSIVEVTQKTVSNSDVQRIFGKYPYKRDFYGYMIRFLSRSRPKQAVLDISFELGSDLEHPEKDQLLADAATKAPYPMVSALLFNNNGLSKETTAFLHRQKVNITTQKVSAEALKQWTVGDNINLPFKAFRQTPVRFSPATTLVSDASKIIRRVSPLTRIEREGHPQLYLPALTFTPLLAASNTVGVLGRDQLDFGEHTIHLHGQMNPVIRWYGNIKHKKYNEKTKTVQDFYPKFEAWDLIRNELLIECHENPKGPLCQKIRTMENKNERLLKPDVFNEQVVLLGIALENNDVHPSIYGSDYPGLYMQANILDNVLHDDFVQVADLWVTLLTCFLMLFMAIYWGVKVRVSRGLPMLLALGFLYYGLTFVAYSQGGVWINWIWPTFVLTIASIFIYTQRYISGENKRQQLRYAFAKYVSPGTMQSIEKNPEKQSLQGGQRRELTYLFCDIRGFTRFSENHEPEYVQHILTQYFRVMNTLIIQTYQGSIDKLLGDAIMAYWGFPLLKQDQTFLAVSAALAMKEAMEHWEKDAKKPPIAIGIGINTGTAMIGNVGSEDFMDFTVIGDAVNIASRLEQLNKEYKTTIIISASTYEKVKDRIECQSLGIIKIRGKEKETQIYEALRLKDNAKAKKMMEQVEKLYTVSQLDVNDVNSEDEINSDSFGDNSSDDRRK